MACLSVIEHGVNVEKFLASASRVLKPGGHLFISTDFWEDPIDTGVSDWRIFRPGEIWEIAASAPLYGLTLTSPLKLECGEKVCHHGGCDYTFVNMLFQKNL
jgi:SAM-dependent methyltransferase